MRNFLGFLICVLLLWHWGAEDHLGYYLSWQPAPTPGVLAPEEPLQTLIPAGEMAPWHFKGCSFTALASYRIRARLLHRQSYVDERLGDISPIDYALGWGKMSDPTVYRQLELGQSVRWFSYSYQGLPPLSEDEMNSHSSNNHLIPATQQLTDQLFSFHPGDVVQLNGYLVQVEAPGLLPWRSSLSRTDTGNGACEIMWVSSAAKVGR
jgi:hypothetical protein